jgi:hypothetical protein
MKADHWVDRWKGRTVVCIASGPSLTEDDCEAARQSGHPAIVTNTTFKRCLWADVLFAFDGAWLKCYRTEFQETFEGEVVTYSQLGKMLGAQPLHSQPWFRNFGNSGVNAISLAVATGAKRVVMLGYDCQRTDGKVHWHGDHPRPLGNAGSMVKWPKHFERVAKYAKEKGVEVVNASRQTALTCFPRMMLEDAL